MADGLKVRLNGLNPTIQSPNYAAPNYAAPDQFYHMARASTMAFRPLPPTSGRQFRRNFWITILDHQAGNVSPGLVAEIWEQAPRIIDIMSAE
jgi:hypothetical protein